MTRPENAILIDGEDQADYLPPHFWELGRMPPERQFPVDSNDDGDYDIIVWAEIFVWPLFMDKEVPFEMLKTWVEPIVGNTDCDVPFTDIAPQYVPINEVAREDCISVIHIATVNEVCYYLRFIYRKQAYRKNVLSMCVDLMTVVLWEVTYPHEED